MDRFQRWGEQGDLKAGEVEDAASWMREVVRGPGEEE